mgnify:CR=1 FL=1
MPKPRRPVLTFGSEKKNDFRNHHLRVCHMRDGLKKQNASDQKQKLLERINTNRLQLKFARSVAALPPAIRACVKELEGRMMEELKNMDALRVMSPTIRRLRT